jgi:hypothetical protein
LRWLGNTAVFLDDFIVAAHRSDRWFREKRNFYPTSGAGKGFGSVVVVGGSGFWFRPSFINENMGGRL